MSADPSPITSLTYVSPTILRLTKVNDSITARGLPLTVTGCWTSHGIVDTRAPHAEACSKASGLTPPKWL